MKPTKKTAPVAVRLAPELASRLQAISDKTDLPVSTVIRLSCSHYADYVEQKGSILLSLADSDIPNDEQDLMEVLTHVADSAEITPSALVKIAIEDYLSRVSETGEVVLPLKRKSIDVRDPLRVRHVDGSTNLVSAATSRGSPPPKRSSTLTNDSERSSSTEQALRPGFHRKGAEPPKRSAVG